MLVVAFLLVCVLPANIPAEVERRSDRNIIGNHINWDVERSSEVEVCGLLLSSAACVRPTTKASVALRPSESG